ncbi:hypothetical protein QQX98_000446 [Neonectria punicea]|uniref:Uncharacterized protein n=1 Tax=Neonectria punicea TaxID=979145 RepID=A0ABR1HTT6_9HYPO
MATAASKMSWAAKRVTTRPEDIAYCLLGMFDVKMPLLYGEGREKAFVRLQEEFLKFSDDETIFAWETDATEASRKPYWGLFATSPAFFRSGSSIHRPTFKTRLAHHPTNITNRGVHIEFPLIPIPGDKSGTIHLALLQCQQFDMLAIVIQRISGVEQEYTRIAPNLLVMVNLNFFYIPLTMISQDFHKENLLRGNIPDALLNAIRLRATDTNATRVFLKPAPTHFEQIGRFYLKPVLKIDKHIQRQITVSVTRTVLDWLEWGMPNGDGVYYMIDLDLLDPEEIDQLRPETLKNKEELASLELELCSPPDHDHKGWKKSVGLAIGLEPLPENPFMTPPAFIRPWYRLFRVNEETSSQGDAEDNLGNRQSWKLPSRCRLKLNITIGIHFEQLIYNIQLEIVPRDV